MDFASIRSQVANLNLTRMVIQEQLVEPAVCSSDVLTSEELIHSGQKRKRKYVCLLLYEKLKQGR